MKTRNKIKKKFDSRQRRGVKLVELVGVQRAKRRGPAPLEGKGWPGREDGDTVTEALMSTMFLNIEGDPVCHSLYCFY